MGPTSNPEKGYEVIHKDGKVFSRLYWHYEKGKKHYTGHLDDLVERICKSNLLCKYMCRHGGRIYICGEGDIVPSTTPETSVIAMPGGVI